jgi:hypothetical protein
MIETRDFLHESDDFMTPDGNYCAQMRVVIEVLPSSKSSGTSHVKSIFDEDNKVFRKLEEFGEKEQKKILKQAEALANAWNYHLYQEQNVFYVKAE